MMSSNDMTVGFDFSQPKTTERFDRKSASQAVKVEAKVTDDHIAKSWISMFSAMSGNLVTRID